MPNKVKYGQIVKYVKKQITITAIRSSLELDKDQIESIVKKYINDEKEKKKIVIYLLKQNTSKMNEEISKIYDGIGKHVVSKVYTRVRDKRAVDKKIDKILKMIEREIS